MKKRKETLEVSALVRAANFQPDTFNEKERTAEIIFSTGAQVKRFPFFDEPFIEELGLEAGNVRMERLETGAPLLNNHSADTLENVIGVVERAEIKDGVGLATVRFSERESVQGIVDDVKSGVLRNISVGYRVHSLEKVGEQDGINVMRATDWEPIEISVVPAGADNGAKIRTTEEKNFCTVISETKEEEAKPLENEVRTEIDKEEPSQETSKSELQQEETKTEVRTDNKEKTHSIGEKKMEKEKEVQLRKEIALNEKNRQKEIRHAIKSAGFETTVADKLIDEDKTVDEARALVIDMLAERDAETETTTTNVEIVTDERDVFKAGVKTALLHRHNPTINKADENSNQYKYRSLLEIAERSLNVQGVKTGGMSKNEIAKRALHSSSDFPEILANVANKTLRDGYAEAPRTFEPFTRETTLPDFKQVSRTNLGDGEKLEEIAENGEIKHGTMSEAAEKYSLKSYGKIIGIGRQALINDDMSAFSRVPEKLGRRARDLESDLVWGLINSNPLMADGNAVFSAPHGNLGTAGAPTDVLLGEGRRAMRLQVGLDGEKINIVPQWFYVPPSLETVAEKLIASIVPDSSTNVSPFSQSGRTPLQLGVESRLEDSSATAWYLMAGLGQLDMVELARLEGENGPMIETMDVFDTDGVKIKIRHDVAAKVIDFRGLFKNNG